jgi:hypothetical protein
VVSATDPYGSILGFLDRLLGMMFNELSIWITLPFLPLSYLLLRVAVSACFRNVGRLKWVW